MPDPRLLQTRDLLEQLFRDGTVVARFDGSVRELFPRSIPAEEGEALREWVKREGATLTLETGLGHGISALFICEGLLENGSADARHVVLDPYQVERFLNCGLQIVEDAGLSDLVEFHADPSEIALPRFLAEGRRFDFAFADGNHLFDGIFMDLIFLGRLVRPSGVVVVDDFQMPSVSRAVAFCTTNLGWTVEKAWRGNPHHEWAVLRTPEVPDERNQVHFVEFAGDERAALEYARLEDEFAKYRARKLIRMADRIGAALRGK